MILHVCRKNIMQGLTGGGNLLILDSPKPVRGVAIAVSQSPTVKKVLPAISAIFRAPAGIVSSGQRVSIGRPATSSIREDWRSRTDRGALYGLPLFLIPEIVRGCYVPELC
jgi:hypothetical protein